MLVVEQPILIAAVIVVFGIIFMTVSYIAGWVAGFEKAEELSAKFDEKRQATHEKFTEIRIANHRAILEAKNAELAAVEQEIKKIAEINELLLDALEQKNGGTPASDPGANI